MIDQFIRTEDAHCLFEICRDCGGELIFTRGTRAEEIGRAKSEHDCEKAQAAVSRPDCRAA
jgi:hypothetical protein